MITISIDDARVNIGNTCSFTITKANPDISYQVFVAHELIQYQKPITPYITAETFKFFPEAPGHYQLIFRWRNGNHQHGQATVQFNVSAGKRIQYTPQGVKIKSDFKFWAPNEWEASLLSQYEVGVIKDILRYIKPGWTIYDVGANLGFYSAYFAKATGKNGQVYSIEANPVCIYFLQSNLSNNQISNCTIFPVALLDNDESVPFTLNYASSALGVTQKSTFFSAKAGHEILVKGTSLDALIASQQLAPPNLIKIDIEGTEFHALLGMEQTLRADKPLLLIEIHGKTVAEKILPYLERLGYAFREINSTTAFEPKTFLASLSDRVFQIICVPN